MDNTSQAAVEQGLALLKRYFPKINAEQEALFAALYPVYERWNQQVNLISRKDFPNLYLKHVLHSLAVAKVLNFNSGSRVVDVGTGGGFPGVPLAIWFPHVRFYLVDSIGKKVKVVKEVLAELKLPNASAEQARSNEMKGKYDFVVARAVTQFPKFLAETRHLVSGKHANALPNGILYLKGGELGDELAGLGAAAMVYPVTDFFPEEEFKGKKIVYWSS